MVSGVLFLAVPLISFFLPGGYIDFIVPQVVTDVDAISRVAMVVALLLVPGGMVGFHALQGRSYRSMGRAGFLLVVVGSLVATLGGEVFFTLGKSGDFLEASPPLVGVVMGLLGLVAGVVGMVAGLGLYGVATQRARVLPRWCGVAFVAPAAGAALALAITIAITVIVVLSYDLDPSRMEPHANLMLFLLLFSLFFQGFLLVFSLMFGLAWMALGIALWARRKAPEQRSRRVR